MRVGCEGARSTAVAGIMHNFPLSSVVPSPVPLVRPKTHPAAGNNEQQQKVEMTAPVTVRVIPSQGPFCEDNFQISFFVPFAVI